MSNSDWWSKKLGNPTPQPQAPATPPTFAVQPQPATYAQPQVPSYPVSQQVTPQAPRCPECGSGNYTVAAKQVTQNGEVSSWRCYDCGYPKIQAGSRHGGASSASSSGPTQKAKQVPTGGWNPTTIIGKL